MRFLLNACNTNTDADANLPRRRLLRRPFARGFSVAVQEVAPLHGDSPAISFVPRPVADSAFLPGSVPELSSFSSGVSDDHRARAVLADGSLVPWSCVTRMNTYLSAGHLSEQLAGCPGACVASGSAAGADDPVLADSALPPGSVPELSSFSSGVSDAHRAQVV